jgi:hypothetical protein
VGNVFTRRWNSGPIIAAVGVRPIYVIVLHDGTIVTHRLVGHVEKMQNMGEDTVERVSKSVISWITDIANIVFHQAFFIESQLPHRG